MEESRKALLRSPGFHRGPNGLVVALREHIWAGKRRRRARQMQ
jgi:hypothetical protein